MFLFVLQCLIKYGVLLLLLLLLLLFKEYK